MYQRILAPLDGSETSNRVAAAIGLAQAFGSRLRLIHVVEELAHLSGYDTMGVLPAKCSRC